MLGGLEEKLAALLADYHRLRAENESLKRELGRALDQQRTLGSRQIMDLPQIGALWHQDQPGKTRVIHQQQATKRPVAKHDAVGGKARMEGEAIRHGASLASASPALQP